MKRTKIQQQIVEVEEALATGRAEMNKAYLKRDMVKFAQKQKQVSHLTAMLQRLRREESVDIDSHFTSEERMFINLCIARILMLSDLMETTCTVVSEKLERLKAVGLPIEDTYFFGKVQKIKKEVKNLRSTSTLFELDKVQEEFGNCCDELDELVTNKAKKFFRKYSELFMAASRTDPEGIPNERQTENTTK